jgi:hypothetical protein
VFRNGAILAVALAVSIGALLPCARSAPPPDSPTTYRHWFQSQSNSKNQLCCSIADGRILRLDQVRQTDRGWEVQLPDVMPRSAGMDEVRVGDWIRVPPENILYTENPTGQPVAWFYNGEVRCFVLPPQI